MVPGGDGTLAEKWKKMDAENSKVAESCVKSIKELPFEQFVIPAYQRPYKWTAKNVNQLITDIITFRDKSQYRLGTLVLYGNEIVDGQQRIVTLVLLLRTMYQGLKDAKLKESYKAFAQKLDAFADKTEFSNIYSLHNIVENLHVIEARESDFDDELFKFVLNKCEFVKIRLDDISEAFQFFDSQNARGKDLAAHDLLKAYHLREISDLKESDSRNIDCWQSQKTSYLEEIFLTLYRAKRWSQGKSARYFTKSKIDIFKGVSLHDGKRYPFYQMEIIAHIFSEYYANDPTRLIDRRVLEYPFNLDDQIINGSRFFDMVRHYMDLYASVRDMDFYPKGDLAEKIMTLVNDYDGMYRTGDQYVRSMFDTLILYYVDRFGKEELDKVIPKFFVWAYKLRLENPAVKRATMDNYAASADSMLRLVHDAKSPYDIINLYIEDAAEVRISGCEKIADMFKQLRKIKDA